MRNIFRNFQTFDTNPSVVAPEVQQTYSNVPPTQYGGSFLDASHAPTGNIYGQSDFGQQKVYTGSEFDDEPPLLEGD